MTTASEVKLRVLDIRKALKGLMDMDNKSQNAGLINQTALRMLDELISDFLGDPYTYSAFDELAAAKAAAFRCPVVTPSKEMIKFGVDMAQWQFERIASQRESKKENE